jgi:hypothetical protein
VKLVAPHAAVEGAAEPVRVKFGNTSAIVSPLTRVSVRANVYDNEVAVLVTGVAIVSMLVVRLPDTVTAVDVGIGLSTMLPAAAVTATVRVALFAP